jgi:uncharacterized protein
MLLSVLGYSLLDLPSFFCVQQIMSLEEFEVNITQHCTVVTYDLGEAFFKLFEGGFLENGKLTVTAKAVRGHDNIQLLINIVGGIVLVCDRSLEVFEYPVYIEKKVTFILGQEDRELAEDLYTIERKSKTINIAQHVYDFVSLGVPMKKLHPRFCDNDAS